MERTNAGGVGRRRGWVWMLATVLGAWAWSWGRAATDLPGPASPDPAAAAASASVPGGFRIVGPPVRIGAGAWRVTWDSIPGRRYLLQRWATDELAVRGEPRWVDVTVVRAGGTTASADDPTAALAEKRYYRVGLLAETGGDAEAPVVSAITPRFTATQGGSAAALTFTATDNVGVVGVSLLNGSTVLGAATRGAGDAWSFVLPLNPKELGARFLIARAVDAAGNIGHSPVFPLGLVDPDHFVPLGPDGFPVEGGVVPAVSAGVWGAVEYRPGGRNLLGFGPGFFLRFPQGVRLVNEGGVQFLEFTAVTAGFGARYPLQLTRTLTRTTGPVKRLRVGPVDLADVMGIFDLDPAAGVPVRVYDRFPLIWRAGVVDDGGIRGARFGVASTGLPLPGMSGDYPEFAVDFTRTTGLRLPFHGEWSLPDGTANPVRLRAGDANPLWLTLAPDGEVTLEGSAELVLPNGGYAHVYLSLDEPNYRIRFEADRLHARTLSSFVDLLPANPGVCLPTGGAPGAATLDQATRCLESFARAYANFAGTVAGLTVSNSVAGGGRPASPPEPFSTLGSVIEAWGFSATAATAQRLPLDLIRDVVRQAGPGASAGDLTTAMAHRLALLRALQAVRSNAATASTESLVELESSLAEVEAAGLVRAQDPDAAHSLESLTRAVRDMLDGEALRQALGRPRGALLDVALPGLLQRFAERFATALGVQAGVFVPDANPRIATLNRFAAAERVHQLVEFLALVQLLGVDLAATRIDETLGQLAIRLATAALADVALAEATDDVPGIVLAVADVMDVVSARELAIFPDTAAVTSRLPSVADLSGLGARMDAVLQRDLAKPLGDRTFHDTAAEIRALLRVLRGMPAGVTFAAPSFRRAFDRMESALAAACNATALAAEVSLVDLVQLLEAGTLHSELGARFGFAPGEGWLAGRLPRVTARLAGLATERRGWSELEQAVRLLFGAAAREGLANDQVERLEYLRQAVPLLTAERSVAGTMLREAGGAVGVADLLLPGEIRVEDVAGYADYNVRSGAFAGAFRGALFLPKFETALVVNNASIGAGGAFDLNLFGTAPFPGGRVTIPGRRPLHVSYDEQDGVRFRGEGRVELASGMAFDAFLVHDDPFYAFGMAAQGLRFSLGRELTLRVPTLGANQVAAFTDATREAFQGYLRDLGATLETLVGAVTNFPAIDPTEFGRPPEFEVPPLTVPLDELNALANALLLPAQAGVADLVRNTFGAARDKLLAMNREAEEARTALASEREILENQIARVAARRRARQAFDEAADKMGGDADAQAKAEELLAAGNDGFRQELLLTYQLVTRNLLDDLPQALRVAKVFLDYEGTVQDMGADFADLDLDGATNAVDKCPAFPEVTQRDTDGDGFGDVCDDAPRDPAVPGTSALARVRQKGIDVMEAGQLLAYAAATNRLAFLGINPTNGAVANPARLSALTEDELEFHSRLFLALVSEDQLLGVSDTEGVIETGALNVHRRLGLVLLDRFNATLPGDVRGLYERGRRLLWAASAAVDAGDTNYPVSAVDVADQLVSALTGVPQAELETLAKEFTESQRQRAQRHQRSVSRELAGNFRPDDLADLLDESPGFIFDVGEFLRVLDLPVPPEFNARMADLVRYRMEQLRLRTISPDFLRLRAGDAIEALDTVIDVIGWVTRQMPGDVAAGNEVRLALERITVPLTAVAEARKEWWVVERYAERLRAAGRLYGNRLDAATRQALTQAANGTLLAAQRIGTALAQLLQSVRLEQVVLQLPGEIRVPHVFGAVYVNRATDAMSGTFGGRVELPAMGGTLEILNASVSNRGDYEVNAFGSLQIPMGTLSIPARRPLLLRHREPDRTALAGAVRLDLTNGMHFEAYLGLEDPVYTFGASAGGLKFDLVEKLIVQKPVLGGTEVFGRELAGALTDYLDRLNASFESLAALTTPLTLEPAAPRPEFRAPSVTLEFDALEAFANSVNLALVQGRQASHEAAYGAVKATLGAIAGGATTLRNGLAGIAGRGEDLERQAAYNAAMQRLAIAFFIMGTHEEFGDPTPLSTSRELEQALETGRTNTLALLRSPTATASLPTTRQVAKLALDFAAAEQQMGRLEDDSVFAALPGFFEAGRSNLFVQLGLHPRTGEVANSAVLEAIPLTLLDNHVKDLIGYEAELQLTGVEPGTNEVSVLAVATGVLANRQRTLILERLCEEPNLHYFDRQFLVSTMWELVEAEQTGAFAWPETVTRLDCSTGPASLDADVAGLVAQSERVLRERGVDQLRNQLERALDRVDPFAATLLRMKLRFRFDLNATVLDPLRREARQVLEGLDALASQPWPRDRMRDGVGLLQGIIDLSGALEALAMPEELQRVREIVLPTVTVQFTAVAEAQKAWWELTDFTRRLLRASERRVGQAPTVLADAFLAAATASVRAADRITQAFAALRPGFERLDLALPGDDLVIREVFGGVLYNRQTRFLEGTLGGRLEFPSLGTNVYFQIQRARLANDGSFAIDASTGGPLPFGRVRLDASVAVASSRQAGWDLSGTGQLIVPSNTRTQIFGVALAYDQSAERLRASTTANNLNLRFTDDFVLFDAGFGFDVSLNAPRGRFTASGSAGLVARTKPLPAAVDRSRFELVVDGVTTSFAYEPGGFQVALEQGVLRLPEIFRTGICPTNSPGIVLGPSIVLTPGAPVAVTYVEAPESVRFGGALEFRNIGFEVPGLTNLAVEVCSARLEFPTNALPRLTNVTATVQLPLPGRTNRVDLTGAAFRLDGFPTGTLALREDLTVFSQGGFEFLLLGTANPSCNLPTALTIARQADGQPFYRIDGGIEFAVPPSALGNTNGGRLFARSCGFVDVAPNRAPRLQMENFALGGTMRLGGAGGLLIENALLALDGLTNLYQQSPTRPFDVRLSGFVNIPDGPRLGLQEAKFSFVGETLPRFSIAGMSIAQNPDYEAAPGLLLNVSSANLVFLNPNAPFPQVLFPTNVQVGISAQLNIPPGDRPIISGRVQDLRARIVEGGLKTQLSGFGVSINNLEFPPLSVTGEVFLGGLDTVNAQRSDLALAGLQAQGRPPGLFFAGRVGGTLNDVGVKALLAFDLRGPIGICLDANAGPAGIPLGPTGFLLTGANGGVSFLNSNGDPCNFATFYPVDANGRPMSNDRLPQALVDERPGAAMTWEEYAQYLARVKVGEAASQRIAEAARRRSPKAALMQVSSSAAVADFTGLAEGGGEDPAFAAAAAAGGAPEFPCPSGDCPSPTVNILCQPHPDEARFPNRVILKFTSLDEKALNDFGITRAFVEGLGLTDARSIGANVASRVRNGIDPLVPRADPALLGATRAGEINAGIVDFLEDLETLLAEVIRVGVGAALGDAGSVYQKIVESAYAGVPCPDATVRLAGTFSHASVSTALSATAGVVLSTTGSAGVVGSLNVMGVPVGTTRSFVSATDNRGDPNPSFCGETLFGVGPLELGRMKSKYECPGCVTGMLGAFGQLTGCLADEATRAILARVAPQHRNRTTSQALALLTDAEKLAFLAHLYSMPAAPGLGDCFATAARSAVDSFNPSFLLCGEVTPKLFGLPLSGALVEANVAASRTNLAAQVAFSPSFIINNLMLCAATLGGGCTPIFPALDSASLGFGFGVPDVADAVVGAMEGRFSSPEELARFARESFDAMLANATFTIGYEINPFGFKLADAEARVLLPNLTEHPARPGSGYVPPEDRGQNLPSRLKVALTALERGFLANPLWKGTADDLPQIFPEGSTERSRLAEARLSFQKDYFPHGGILGAARLALPRVIADAPPAALGVLLDPAQDVFARLGAASELLGDYILATSEVGTLAFYVPAPNPPFFADSEGRPLTPAALLAAIQTFDPSAIRVQSLYPLERFFFAGYLEGRLLGVPVGRADIEAMPATPTSGAFFRLRAGVPADSWLKEFLESASMEFVIRESPPVPIEQRFGELKRSVDQLRQAGGTPQAVATLVNQVGASVADSLPKVSLDLTVNNLRIPDPLTNLLTAETSARLVAYSPRFNPAFVGEGPVAEVTRRGGIAVQGRFRFANLVTVTDAQLGIFPTDATSLPGLAGRFRVPQLGIPGAALHDATFDFNSAAATGQPFLAASGAIDPLEIRNPLDGTRLLSIVPLNSGTNRIGAAFNARRGAGNTIQGSFQIDPARVSMPMLGPDVSVTVHGATPSERFSFSTTESWGASVTIDGRLSVRDPSNFEVARIGSSGGRFSATLTGQGLALTSLIISNLPSGLEITTFPNTGFERRFVIGGTTPGQLRIHSDGTFLVSAALGANLTIPGLPTPALRSGATVELTQQGLRITGLLEGGLLAPGATANGTFSVTSQGVVSLTGSATIPPLAFGSIVLRGTSADNLTVNLFHDGYSIPNGARLQVIGLNNDFLVVSPFTNRANLDFTASVQSGNFTVPGFFRLTGGQMEFRRRSSVVSVAMQSPTLTLMPGTPQQNTIAAPFTNLVVSSEGLFYADSGTRELNLLGALKLSGRLEIGNAVGGGTTSVVVSTNVVEFGTLDFGATTNRSVRFSNTGTRPVLVSLLSGSAVVPAQNDVLVPPGEFRQISLQFRPTVAGRQTNEVQVFFNPGGQQASISARGEARAVPIFQASAAELRFGEVALGGRATRHLTLRNVGVAPLTITNATVGVPFTVEPVLSQRVLQPGEEVSLAIGFAPTALGAASGTLTVRASDQASARSIPITTGNAYAERWVRLREGGPTLRGIAMLNTNTGWAVGDEGAFLRTDDGGRSWAPVAAGFSGNFRSIAIRGASVAVAGDDGVAAVSTNAGATWRRLTAPLMAATTNHWRGVVWCPLGTANPSNIESGSRLVFVGARDGGGGIVAREDSGAFVSALLTSNALQSVAFGLDAFVINQNGKLIAVGDAGLVVRSPNGGTNWTSEVVNGGFIDLRGVAFGGTSAVDTQADAWVVGASGLLMTATSSTAALNRVFGPTLEDFQAVRVGYLAGNNGSAYSRLSGVANAPFVRDNPSGAYDLLGLTGVEGALYAVGQFGQIHFRPPTAPTGPVITVEPGALDFGVQPLNRTRALLVTVRNRGFAPLSVTSIGIGGSGTFTASTSQLLNIATNGAATFEVRFTPTALGEFGAELLLVHNESTRTYRVPLRGVCQANTWGLVATPDSGTFRDVQFTSTTTGYAATGGQVYKTTDGGTNWTPTSLASPGFINRIGFFSDSLGFAVGGSTSRFNTIGCDGPCLSLIARTGDGGATWTIRSTGLTTAIADLHMVSSTTGFAVARSKTPLGLGATTPGEVLRTTDGGLTWTKVTRPVPASGVFSGSAVHAISGSVVFVAGNGQLFRSADGGTSWTSLLNTGVGIEDLQFVDANNGWLVGDGGLLRRTTSGGGTAASWTTPASFTSANLRRVHFASTTLGWVVGGDASLGQVFRTDNGGTSWRSEFREILTTGSFGPTGVSGRSTSQAYAVNGQGVYRSAPFNPAATGSPSLAGLTDFGVLPFGTNATRTVTLRNLGSVALVVRGIGLEDDTPEGAFRITSPTVFPATVAARSSLAITVVYTPPTVARHHARLIADTDGSGTATVTDVVGEAEIRPTSIRFVTEPPGLRVLLDGRSTPTPETVTVVGESKVPNDVINIREWRFGTEHVVSVATSQVLDGYEYRFQGWEPARNESFTVLATNVPATYRARFVPIRSLTPALAGRVPGMPRRDVALASTGAPLPPTDVPGGPYIRVSGARLEVPAMGGLDVQGAAFLGGDRFEFALDGDPLGTPGLLTVDAGSWRVSYTNTADLTRFVLRARNPGLTVLDKPVTGSSEVLLDIVPERIVARFNTTGNLPILPAMVELGPTTLAFTNGTQAGSSTRFSSFRATGDVRLLALPGGGFAATQNFGFFASDRPFTNEFLNLPATLIDTPLLKLTRPAGGKLTVSRNGAGQYGLNLSGFDLSLLGGNPIRVSAAAEGSRLLFNAGATLALGSLRFEGSAATTVNLDFAGPSFRAVLPDGDLVVPKLAQRVRFGGFTIDSAGNFDRKITLPSLTFDGIGINGGGPLEHNFVRLFRQNGVVGFQFRDRRSFLDNTFKLAIDIDSAGTATGTFSGNLSVKDFMGCSEIGVGDLRIGYNGSASDGFQFKSNVRLETCLLGAHDFRVKFGSAGGRFCHLVCGSGGCTEDLCFP